MKNIPTVQRLKFWKEYEARDMSWMRRWRFLRMCHINFGLFLFVFTGVIGFWYANFIPPWWNYDEPRHFWLAWTLTRGEITFEDKKRVIRSLLEYNWFYHYPRNMWPSEDDIERFPGVLAATWRPPNRLLYWRIITLPWYIIPASWDVAWQLRVLRWMSVLFFIATAWALWKAAQELFGKDHPLSRVVPLFAVLLPGFAEPMNLVNDDTGAALGGTLFFWASLRLMRRGFRWDRFLLLLVAAWIAQSMKRTAVPLLALLPVVVLLSFRWRWRVVFWVLLGGGGLVMMVLTTFRWGDPAYWYYDRVWEEPLRVPSPWAQDGEWVFRIPPGTEFGQWIPIEVYNDYPPGTEWMLSFWMWADQSGEVALPRLCVGYIGVGIKGERCTPREKAFLSTEPRYFEVSLTTLEEGDFPRIEFPPHDADLGAVYIDDVILTMAPRPSEGRQTNLLRNGSAEEGWWGMKSWFAPIAQREGGFLSVILAALQDPRVRWIALRREASFLFKTTWGFFARAKIPYLGEDTYKFLLLWSILGMIGYGVFAVRKSLPVPSFMFAVLVLGFVFIIGSVLLFPIGRLHGSASLLTWFRYAFPAILPFSVILALGWYGLLGPQRIMWLVRFVLGLNILAGWSIADFFYPQWAELGYILTVVMVSLVPLPILERVILGEDSRERSDKGHVFSNPF